jgi:hypothetical protein
MKAPDRRYPDASCDLLMRAADACRRAYRSNTDPGSSPQEHSLNRAAAKRLLDEIGWVRPSPAPGWEVIIDDLDREWALARLEEIGRDGKVHEARLRAQVFGVPHPDVGAAMKFLRSILPEPASATDRVGALSEQEAKTVLATILYGAENLPRDELVAADTRLALRSAGLLAEEHAAHIDVKA